MYRKKRKPSHIFDLGGDIKEGVDIENGSGSEGGGGGVNYGAILSGVSEILPQQISYMSNYNAPIGDNAKELGDSYVAAKQSRNKTRGILGGLGLLAYTDDISKDITNLEDNVAAKIDAINNVQYQGANTLDEAMNNLASLRKFTRYTADDLSLGKNKYASGFGTALKGASLGTSIAPGWGTLIGALAGTATGIIGGELNDREAKLAASSGANAINSAADEKERFLLASTQNSISNIRNRNLRMNTNNIRAYGGPLGISLNPVNGAIDYMQNEDLLASLDDSMNRNTNNNRKVSMPTFAFGGALGGYGGDWSNGLTYIGAGGTHEQNPLGGVLAGISQDGKPNQVEQGEFIWKDQDYVFSARLFVPKSDYEMLGLKKRKNGYTYAEAAEIGQKESSERPNDAIAKRGKDAFLMRLMQSQEQVRTEKMEKEQYNQSEDIAAFAADGGPIHIAKNKKGTFTAAATKHGMGVQEFAGHVLANKDKYSPAMVKKANFARNASKWHHALGGYLFPDGGYMIPTAWSSDLQNMLDRNWKNSIAERSPYINEFNRLNNSNLTWGQIRDIIGSNNYTIQDNTIPQLAPRKVDRIDFTEASGLGTFPSAEPLKNPNGAITSGLNGNLNNNTDLPTSGWQTALRYAPAIGPLLAIGHSLANKPDYEYANALTDLVSAYKNQVDITPDYLGDYLSYDPFDRLFYANELRANQAAANRAIENMGNSNLGAMLAARMANDYNNNIALGKLYREGEEYNLGQRQKVAEFNRATNQYNSQLKFNADAQRNKGLATALGYEAEALKMKQAEDAAYWNSLMANLTAAFDNFGAIGEDAYNRYDRNRMIKSGVTPQLPGWWLNDISNGHAACGGKISRKKRKGLTI